MNTQHTEQTEREELIRLADGYAEALAKFRMEDLYGTSKTYTANCKEEADEARQALIAALLAEDKAGGEPTKLRFETALRQWEHWKAYALELQAKLVKYEGGAPMILNTEPQAQEAQR